MDAPRINDVSALRCLTDLQEYITYRTEERLALQNKVLAASEDDSDFLKSARYWRGKHRSAVAEAEHWRDKYTDLQTGMEEYNSDAVQTSNDEAFTRGYSLGAREQGAEHQAELDSLANKHLARLAEMQLSIDNLVAQRSAAMERASLSEQAHRRDNDANDKNIATVRIEIAAVSERLLNMSNVSRRLLDKLREYEPDYTPEGTQS